MKKISRPAQWALLALLVLLPLKSWAQADGPRSQVLIPTDVSIVVPAYLHLSGNYSFGGNVLVPGADVDSNVFMVSYLRAFDLAGRYAQIYITPVFGNIDAKGAITPPGTGQPVSANVSTSGLGDAIVNFKIGLVGAEPLGLKDFGKQNQGFHVDALFGLTLPTGDYDEDKPLNLGKNVWAFRFGLPLVWRLGAVQHPTFLEVIPSATFYSDNSSPTLGADVRTQDALFDIQTHLSRNFTPKFWASLDLRYRSGGETTTDGVADDNRQDVLGGGVSAGYAFTPNLAAQMTLGMVLAESDGSEEDMIRVKVAYSFF
jgi:hypothetical protein